MSEDAYTRALMAWLRYYVATEEHDRRVCSNRDGTTGDAIPRTEDERRLSYIYARVRRRNLQASCLSVDESTFQQAKRDACSMSYERQRYLLGLDASLDADRVFRFDR